MKAEIVGKNLVITIKLQKPSPSKKGKSLIVATSHGFQATTAVINGKPVTVSLNAVIKKES